MRKSLSQRRIDAALQGCAAGKVTVETALLRLIFEIADPDACLKVIEKRLGSSDGAASERLQALAGLARMSTGNWHRIRGAAAAVSHAPSLGLDAPGAVARFAAAFDMAARISPEASVALYSLSDATRLAMATNEIVGWLRQLDLTGKDRDWLDIGCGIGRLEIAIAGEVHSITGIDVSSEMVRIARRRCRHARNVTIAPTSGLDLSEFATARFDCVIGVDSFPYLVLAGEGLAMRHVEEAARVLKPGGSLVILNFSYRDWIEEDRSELSCHAENNGFRIAVDGERPFAIWDAAAFQLVRSAEPATPTRNRA